VECTSRAPRGVRRPYAEAQKSVGEGVGASSDSTPSPLGARMGALSGAQLQVQQGRPITFGVALVNDLKALWNGIAVLNSIDKAKRNLLFLARSRRMLFRAGAA